MNAICQTNLEFGIHHPVLIQESKTSKQIHIFRSLTFLSSQLAFVKSLALMLLLSLSCFLFTMIKLIAEINQGYKINKPLSGLLVYQRIIALAKRLSSKFNTD